MTDLVTHRQKISPTNTLETDLKHSHEKKTSTNSNMAIRNLKKSKATRYFFLKTRKFCILYIVSTACEQNLEQPPPSHTNNGGNNKQ